MSFNKLLETKNGLGYARWLHNTLRIHRNMFWDHLTLPNIGNSLFQLQISTLGPTIGPQNPPLRPGVSQETFWILDSCFRILDSCFWILDSGIWIVNYEWWIMIDDYDWWLWLMTLIDEYDWWLWLMIMIDDHDLWLSIIHYRLLVKSGSHR